MKTEESSTRTLPARQADMTEEKLAADVLSLAAILDRKAEHGYAIQYRQVRRLIELVVKLSETTRSRQVEFLCREAASSLAKAEEGTLDDSPVDPDIFSWIELFYGRPGLFSEGRI